MKLEFIQEDHTLGESGLEETEALQVLVDGVEAMNFTQYLLLADFADERWWNPRRDRACFVAQRYGEGFFPSYDYQYDARRPRFLCVYEIFRRRVVAEIPIAATPDSIRWDASGDLPVVGDNSAAVRASAVFEAREEFAEAWAHMNRGGTITKGDPINDPTRLEYYLFDYDPRYAGPSPYDYAARRRDQYLRSQGKPQPQHDFTPEELRRIEGKDER